MVAGEVAAVVVAAAAAAAAAAVVAAAAAAADTAGGLYLSGTTYIKKNKREIVVNQTVIWDCRKTAECAWCYLAVTDLL